MQSQHLPHRYPSDLAAVAYSYGIARHCERRDFGRMHMTRIPPDQGHRACASESPRVWTSPRLVPLDPASAKAQFALRKMRGED